MLFVFGLSDCITSQSAKEFCSLSTCIHLELLVPHSFDNQVKALGVYDISSNGWWVVGGVLDAVAIRFLIAIRVIVAYTQISPTDPELYVIQAIHTYKPVVRSSLASSTYDMFVT